MKRSTENRGSPERLADVLLARVFRGEYPAGSRLPPERQLAAELGVDRTTLRMALKQLQRMNLLVARQGSGIEVLDYREHGGLEVLAAIFALDDLPLEGSFIVEALDFWVEVFGMTAAKAIGRMSLDDLRQVERLLDRAIAAAGDPATLVEALIELTDEIARLSGSMLLRMLSTSTRSLRRRVTQLLPATADVAAPLGQMRRALRAAAVSRPPEEEIRQGIVRNLRALTTGLREQLLFGSPSVARKPAGMTNHSRSASSRRKGTR